MSRLQPYEGVTGRARSAEDPLLTPAGSDLVLQLVKPLYRASLSATPNCQELHSQLTNAVRVGQPVAVHDAMYFRRDQDARWKAVGYLLQEREEWATTDSQWQVDLRNGDADPDERGVERDAWYLQYGPAAEDVCRWTNCQVLALPLEWKP